MDLWNYEVFWGNKSWQVVCFFATILIALVTAKIGKYILLKMRQKYFEQNRPVKAALFESLAKSITFLFVAVGILTAFNFLFLPTAVIDLVSTSCSVLVWLSIGYTLYWLVEVPAAWVRKVAARSDSKMHEMFMPLMSKTLRVGIMLLIGVQIATILSDKPVTSIIAGLGIGGLAVALAAQDTIKNFFGSLVIFSDRPFELGDRIVVDGHDGPVESVGLRSTRVRNQDGHLITFPNGELANKIIRNIGKRPYIKRTFNLSITYDTPPEKIDRALAILKDILRDHKGMHADFPPRVYFNDLGSHALNILIIYWYFPPAYWGYMEFSEWVNKEIIRRFEEEEIEFAFPTQTTHLAGHAKHPLYFDLEPWKKAGNPPSENKS